MPTLSAALRLAARGMHVFPCWKGSKKPATTHGLKDATTDRNVIEAWWHREDYNVAIATGVVSGVFVLDVDGLDAEAELRKLEAIHGSLPPSVEAITARGRHVFFRMPDATIANSASKIGPGLDIRGDGGFVIAPPSIHPTGRRYCWSVDSARAFAAAPDWLLERITMPKVTNVTMASIEWRDLIREGVGEGQRNASIARLVGHLLHHHVNPPEVLELAYAFNEARCRPPLSSAEVHAIVNSIAGRELLKRIA
jgi:Bifunctional DNA primase/polymerase, N-terminal/Primase C terminal 1 (PriCT-1)